MAIIKFFDDFLTRVGLKKEDWLMVGNIDNNEAEKTSVGSIIDLFTTDDLASGTTTKQYTVDEKGKVANVPDNTNTAISTAKSEAISTSSEDATSKANTAEANASADATAKANTAESNAIATANGYTDEQITAISLDLTTTTETANTAEGKADAALALANQNASNKAEVDHVNDLEAKVDNNEALLLTGSDAYTHAKRVAVKGMTTERIVKLDEDIEQNRLADFSFNPFSKGDGLIGVANPDIDNADFTGDFFGGDVINKKGRFESVAVGLPKFQWRNNEPRLLIEPQATNTIGYSNDFTQWSIQGTTVTPNTTISPDGNLNASTLSGAIGTSVGVNTLRENVGNGNTFSIYVNSLGATTITLYIRNGINANISSQTFTLTQDWKLIHITAPTANGQVFIGNTDGDVAIWKAQLEDTLYPTSRIDTNASSVTRPLDDNILTGDLSNVINNKEGVFEFKIKNFINGKSNGIRIFGSAGNRIELGNSSTPNLIRSYIQSSLGDFFNITHDVGDQTNEIHYKIKYKSGATQVKVNDVLAFTLTGDFDFTTDLNKIEIIGDGGVEIWDIKYYRDITKF